MARTAAPRKETTQGEDPNKDDVVTRKRNASIGEGESKKAKTMSTLRRPKGSGESSGDDDDLFSKMTRYMDAKFKGMDNNADKLSEKIDDVTTSVTNLTGRVNKNSDDISNLKLQLQRSRDTPTEEIRTQVQTIVREELRQGIAGEETVRKMSEEIDKIKANRTTAATPTGGENNEDKYWRARRALRLWPVRGNNNTELWKATGEFIFQTLEVPEYNLDEEAVETIRKVASQKNNRKKQQRVTDEVLVLFRDVETRDMVQSYATNLANHRGKAGMRLEVPCHLTGHFKCLERYGHSVKKEHGSELKWHVNFDDVERSLRISVKLPGADKWDRIDYQAAKEALRDLDKTGIGAARERLGSNYSSSGASDAGHEEGMEIEPSTSLPRSATLEKFKTKQPRSWGTRTQ